jgi:hypothetical protein
MKKSASSKAVNQKSGMTGSQCIDMIRQLAGSQGYYSRMYADLKQMEQDDPDQYQDVLRSFEAQGFSDPVDMVLHLES